MPLTREQKSRLIAAYEPVLYLHPDERFVPVDPVTFVQSSALWCTAPAGPDDLAFLLDGVDDYVRVYAFSTDYADPALLSQRQ